MTSPREARRVAAVVAARDEEATIEATVLALLALPAVTEVVVAAGRSADRTAELAGAAGARVLTGGGDGGKGAAVEAALDAVPDADVYLLVDGDTGATAAETGALLEAVLSGRLDAAVGRLPAQAGGGFGIVKRMSAALIRALGGVEAAAPLSGQRAVTREALFACRPLAAGFGIETAMTIDLARLGFRVGEVDVAMTHRATGRGAAGFAHRGRQGLDILRAVLPRALRLR